MLDQLRRHASSWLVKGVLTLIILSFILFFGYSSISSRYRDEQNYVAVVGDVGIPRRKFEETYERSLERMKADLKGEVPENLEVYLKKNVLDQLISRERIVRYARDLGIAVSDEEVAEAIRSDKNLFPEGTFDITAYEERFLPSYRQRYGEEFEETIRRDLLIEKIRLFLPALFPPWQDEPGSKISPEDLLTLWVNDQEIPIETFDRR